MTTRLLPAAEWTKLDGTELGAVWRRMDPEIGRVIVVEDEGAIVACWAVMPMLHVEGLWIDPTKRRKGVALRMLWDAMVADVAPLGCQTVVTSAESPIVANLLERRCAVPFPGQMFVLPLAEPPLKSDVHLGERFHAALFPLLPAAAHHEHDEAHNAAVGRAIRVGVFHRNPGQAEGDYNVWAALHGYEPIRFLDQHADGTVAVDIVEAVIAVTPALDVTVILNRLDGLCPEQPQLSA